MMMVLLRQQAAQFARCAGLTTRRAHPGQHSLSRRGVTVQNLLMPSPSRVVHSAAAHRTKGCPAPPNEKDLVAAWKEQHKKLDESLVVLRKLQDNITSDIFAQSGFLLRSNTLVKENASLNYKLLFATEHCTRPSGNGNVNSKAYEARPKFRNLRKKLDKSSQSTSETCEQTNGACGRLVNMDFNEKFELVCTVLHAWMVRDIDRKAINLAELIERREKNALTNVAMVKYVAYEKELGGCMRTANKRFMDIIAPAVYTRPKKELSYWSRLDSVELEYLMSRKADSVAQSIVRTAKIHFSKMFVEGFGPKAKESSFRALF